MLPLIALAALLPAPAPRAFPTPVPTPTATPGDDDEVMTQERLEEIAREIEAEVAELRGADFERPVSVHVADEEEMLGYIRKRMAMEYGPGDFEAEENTSKLLGLIPDDMDLMAEMMRLLESQVGGYYDPAEDAFYLMERFSDSGLTRTIISHELTHALDDQLHGIDRILEGLGDNTDAKMAFHAVVEGSGTAIMQQWSVQKVASGDMSLGEMMEAGDMGMEDLEGMPEALWKPMIAVYLRGQTFLSRTESLMAAGMNPAKAADIDRAFREPPLSTEQVLHPAKYWDAEKRDDPVALHLELDRLPEGWNVLREDTSGELGLALVCTPAAERGKLDASNPMSIMGLRYTNDAAEGWGGDRFVLLGREDSDDLLLVGATVWDTEADATEFREALGEVGIAARGALGYPKAVFYHAFRGLDEANAGRLAGLVTFHIDG